jgi:hypothetical protein
VDSVSSHPKKLKEKLHGQKETQKKLLPHLIMKRKVAGRIHEENNKRTQMAAVSVICGGRYFEVSFKKQW